jgi:HlyD family secretion protein
MPALVTPSTIKREAFGSIKGTVNTVLAHPSDPDAMMAILHNEKLVQSFSKDNAPLLVRMTLHKNPQTLSGFLWSSSQGPTQKITAGTLVQVAIKVRETRPIRLLIPTLRKMIGITP